MTYQNAIKLRDEYRSTIVGQLMIDAYGKVPEKSEPITDVIVSPKESVGEVFTTMWDKGFHNEAAISYLGLSLTEDFDVFVISYHVWGKADLYYFSLNKYLDFTNQWKKHHG